MSTYLEFRLRFPTTSRARMTSTGGHFITTPVGATDCATRSTAVRSISRPEGKIAFGVTRADFSDSLSCFESTQMEFLDKGKKWHVFTC